MVEDEERLAHTLRRGLELEGFVVQLAHTGTDGLYRALEETFDVIVLDIMLPELNGYEVLRPSKAGPQRERRSPQCARRSPHREGRIHTGNRFTPS